MELIRKEEIPDQKDLTQSGGGSQPGKHRKRGGGGGGQSLGREEGRRREGGHNQYPWRTMPKTEISSPSSSHEDTHVILMDN